MKHAAFVAFLLSFGLCVLYDAGQRREIRSLQNEYSMKCVDVRQLADIDAEVRAYQVKRARLQRWIDAINSIKTNDQRHLQNSVAAITTIDQTDGVQVARVIDDQTIEIKTAAGARRIPVKR